MSDLIERLEKVTGADRELDFAIFGSPKLSNLDTIAPRYTASVDAALTLIPENAHLRLATCHEGIVGGHAWVNASTSPLLSFHDVNTDSISVPGCRRSLPVAICIAALKARRKIAAGHTE